MGIKKYIKGIKKYIKGKMIMKCETSFNMTISEWPMWDTGEIPHDELMEEFIDIPDFIGIGSELERIYIEMYKKYSVDDIDEDERENFIESFKRTYCLDLDNDDEVDRCEHMIR